jgi:hypothetical protein
VKQARFIGGLALVGASALLFFANWDAPLPVPIALLIVGIALIATSRRKR